MQEKKVNNTEKRITSGKIEMLDDGLALLLLLLLRQRMERDNEGKKIRNSGHVKKILLFMRKTLKINEPTYIF